MQQAWSLEKLIFFLFVIAMKNLIDKINDLKDSEVRATVNKRIRDFKKLRSKGNDFWFSELCFCILTANSKAETALNIQLELGSNGFLNKPHHEIIKCIKKNKHRFHNTKSGYIVEARKYKKIKNILKRESDPRELLVRTVRGIGWKEGSHFLRNVGYTCYAILDRHILTLLFDYNLIDKKPETLNKKTYFQIEEIFRNLAKRLNLTCAELDLYMWYMQTGRVLK